MTKKVETVLQQLKQNGFEAVYFEKADQAKAYLLKEAASEQSVGFGGSWTLKEMGLFEALKEQGNKAYWHWQPEEGETPASTLLKDMNTDLYMCGINALTLDGRIINIDGTGNRLSSMLFGHKHLYLVAGINKIAGNLQEGMIRIKNEACPKNARRLGLETPCAITGKCENCSSPQRMCNATLILDRQPGGIPTTVVLIGEALGF